MICKKWFYVTFQQISSNETDLYDIICEISTHTKVKRSWVTWQFLDSRHCMPCEGASSRPRLSDGHRRHTSPAASPPPGFLLALPHVVLPYLRTQDYISPLQHWRTQLCSNVKPVTDIEAYYLLQYFLMLTWVEECFHTNLPCSHEPTNLLQIAMSNNILEDDVIGEVHSSLCRGDGYHRCWFFLCLRAMCWAVPWPFAIWRDVCWRRLVSWCVVRWGVMCRAIQCWGVLWCRAVWGCVVAGRVIWRSVIGGCLVCWGVLRSTCVRWHWYVVVVLHPCSGYRSASPYAVSPERGTWEIQQNNSIQQNSSILFFVSFVSSPCSPLILLSPSGRSSRCYSLCKTQALLKSFPSFHYVPIPFFYLVSSTFSCLLWISINRNWFCVVAR